MFSKILDTIKRYDMFGSGDKVVIGISGGSDSVGLLHVLLRIKDLYNLEIYAGHMNHGIRGVDAEKDENFVREVCKKLSVPLFSYKYNVIEEAKKLKITQEEAGRLLRYKCFDEVLAETDSNKIAIAHNLDDSSETMILNFFRGTGLKGLTGIPPVRGNIVRPLIDVTKNEIEEFCRGNSIEYIVDKTNFLPIYTRNKIRTNLIPYVEKEINTNVVKTLYHMSINFTEEESFMAKQGNKAFLACLMPELCGEGIIGISIKNLGEYHNAIKKRILRICVSNILPSLKDISMEHINMLMELSDKPKGKKVKLPLGLTGEIDYNCLVLYRRDFRYKNYNHKILLDDVLFIAEINKYLVVSSKKLDKYGDALCTKIFKCDRIENELEIRTFKPGDKIFLCSVGGNKKIKDIFRDKKIPQKIREKICLIAIGSDIICIFMDDRILSDKYTVNEQTKNENVLYVYMFDKD